VFTCWSLRQGGDLQLEEGKAESLRALSMAADHGRNYLVSEPGDRVHGAALLQREAACPALLARP